jgi:hypothetical protein
MRLYLAYDSKYLIPGMRINASVTYVDDPLYSLLGLQRPGFGAGLMPSGTTGTRPMPPVRT